MAARFMLLSAMLLCGRVAAQPLPTPPTVPAHNPGKTAAPPAPRAPVQPPTVRPKPSTPPKRPIVHPAAPAPAPEPEPVPETPAEPTKGSVTGQPLPRFAALRADEVYMRVGPGKRYPIDWVYKRRDLPVRIEREFEEWRLVRDQENTKGWVHQATLAPRRTGVVIGGERMMRSDGRDDAAPVARLKPGVIVRLRSCEATSDWCQTQVQDYRGWMKRSEIWGLLPGEAIQ